MYETYDEVARIIYSITHKKFTYFRNNLTLLYIKYIRIFLIRPRLNYRIL